jgi:phospholipase/carboxylesterase
MGTELRKRAIGTLKILELTGDPDKGVIILLHGFGADAFDLAGISSVYKGPTWIFPQGILEISLTSGYKGRAWFPINIELLIQAIQESRFDDVAKAFPTRLDQACAAVEELLQQLDIPRSKITLGGFSQGAVLAIETALRSPTRFRGLVIFSGTLVNMANWKRLAPLHAKTLFFQSHGINDPLLPIKKAEELEKLLIDSGLKGKLHVFRGGHEIPPSILSEFSQFLKSMTATE